MDDLERHLRELEEELLSPAIRRDAAAIASLLAEEFCEFGSSGRAFDRRQVIEALQAEEVAFISITEFSVKALATGVALVTYRASRGGGIQQASLSLRSSVWVLRDGRWKMLFHQGTKATEVDGAPFRKAIDSSITNVKK